MRSFIGAISVMLMTAAAAAQDHDHHAPSPPPRTAKPNANKDLPADEAGTPARLSSSPRHAEWVEIETSGGAVRSFVVYPQRRSNAPVVIVIHEIFGLTDWIRGVADQLAAEGFIAIAPDLLSGHGPNGGGTDAYPGRDSVTQAVTTLARDEINTRVNALREYGLRLPAANGRSATVGFCWGGSSGFAYAVAQPALDAAVIFYGTAPSEPGAPQGAFVPAASLGSIHAAVLGLYGGSDARVTATVAATDAKMKELRKVYEREIFDGAGHGFLRAQAEQLGQNMKATEKAWPRTIAFLRKYTEGSTRR